MHGFERAFAVSSTSFLDAKPARARNYEVLEKSENVMLYVRLKIWLVWALSRFSSTCQFSNLTTQEVISLIEIRIIRINILGVSTLSAPSYERNVTP